MPIHRYKVSFTTGGLFYQEAVKVTALYFEFGDWVAVRSEVFDKNLLQSRTRATTGRILRELLPRLLLLSEDQLRILRDGNRKEQNQILWFAVCKQYRLIREFEIEVIREKMLRMDTVLTYSDFDAFFNAKSEWHEELEKLTEMTRKKLRRVLFQMLREAEIISEANQILPMMLSPRVARSIVQEDSAFYAVFPFTKLILEGIQYND